MKIKSSSFENNQEIPAKYACDGEDVNPPLEFSEVSEQCQSIALIVDDPDAPGGTWVHWLVWNINPSSSYIEEDSVPEGSTQGVNSFGKNDYGGPCPPSGTHHYHFKAYALDQELNLDFMADKKALEEAMEGHIIGEADLIGLYQRGNE